MAENRAEEVRTERRRRGDLSENRNLRLAVPEHLKDARYEYRWINDVGDGGRVQMMTVEDDWDIVMDKGINGQGEGTAVTRHSGTSEQGKPVRTFLCRKLKKFYQEDQQAKQDRLLKTEADLMRGPAPNSPGLSAAEAYVPQGHKNVVSRGPT